jgi:diketogulonate reductase-like aldo/keto reductase
MNGEMRQVRLPGGLAVPALGQGTWFMGERPDARAAEVAALRRGLELGMTLIDTAEMYADGAAERVVGEAINGRREEVFLVSKVLPSNASHMDTIKACEQSLRRLGTDRIDLYLLHWRGSAPFSETLEAFLRLQKSGKIRAWGVSNLDAEDLDEWTSLAGGEALATDQVLYNLNRRGIEFDLLPWCRERNIPIMAYSPIEQGRLLGHPALGSVAARHGVTQAQIALAWVLRHPDVIAIPKAGTLAHLSENRAALDIALTPEDLAALDAAFPPPRRKRALEML